MKQPQIGNGRFGCRVETCRIVIVLGLISACSEAPVASSQPDSTALLDRIAIEDLIVDYYSQIGSSDHDYSRYFAADATLQVNGFIVHGSDEIEALYQQVDAGDSEAQALPNTAVNEPNSSGKRMAGSSVTARFSVRAVCPRDNWSLIPGSEL